MILPIRIIPAVLAHNLDEFSGLMKIAESITDYAQVDIMDDKFVRSKSLSLPDLISVHKNIRWEAHLMVDLPETYLESVKKAGADKAIFHYETAPDPEAVIAIAEELQLKIGLAFNPETTVPERMPYIDRLDSVLFLSVHPGFYKAQFLPEVLNKLATFRSLNPGVKTGIDGGVNKDNIVKVAQSRVDEICVGSAVMLAGNPGESYRELKDLVKKAEANKTV